MPRKKKDAAKIAEGELTVSSGEGIQDAVILDQRNGVMDHQDIGSIEPTELDGITINRTKRRIDPFIEIRKERLVDRLTGAPSSAFVVWVPDPDEPEGWRDMGVVSENYLLLTNHEVRMLALEIAEESGLVYKESRIFWDGARFAHVIDFTETTDVVVDDDAICLSLITRTSYDRSWKFEAALMGKRFACDNGVLSGEFFARVTFKHTRSAGSDAWQDVVRQGLSVLSDAPVNLQAFVKGLRLLKAEAMTDTHLREIWKRTPKLGNSLMGKVMTRYVGYEEPTLYGFLNAGTNVFWHNDRMTSADFSNNDVFTSAMLEYANTLRL